MDHKVLTPLHWRGFAKGKGYQDKSLLLALAELQDVLNEDPQEQLAAAAQIDAACAGLAAAHKADKALAERLKAMAAALAEVRRQAQEAIAQAERKPPVPALLSDKLLPLLREARRGLALHALVATTSRASAVMLSRKPIPPAIRKLLRNHLAVSGVKFLSGRCVFEDGAHTFVLAPQVSGIEKRLRAALLAQVGLRLKVAARAEQAG
jgi:hypothetical protein